MVPRPATREKIALWVIVLSIAVLIVVVGAVIITSKKPSDAAHDVLTMVLPVLATWVGTVIAFYFGRENFEAASEQAKQIAAQFPGGRTPGGIISSIMRPLAKIEKLVNDNAGKMMIETLRQFYSDNVTRLLVLDSKSHPKYVVHQSRVDNFLSEGGKTSDTLDAFIVDRMAKKKIAFGDNAGFVTVSKDSTIEDARRKMESVGGCQDIIVTAKGGTDEPVLGWVSNTRLARSPN